MRASANVTRRPAFTLIELLVCFAIIAVLIGILIPAIQSIRRGGVRTQSVNNQRQIILAMHSFADGHDGRFPSIDGNPNSASPNSYGPLLNILPYIDESFVLPPPLQEEHPQLPAIAIYLSPADPTVDYSNPQPLSSYAVNAQAFCFSPRLTGSFGDGTSTTIALAEHYSTNCGPRSTNTESTGIDFGYALGAANQTDDPGQARTRRRATFADGGPNVDPLGSSCGDFYPEPPEHPSATFQLAPDLANSNQFLPQTPHQGGMLVAMVDGSCRIISPSISSFTFWAAVTPSSGELLGTDW